MGEGEDVKPRVRYRTGRVDQSLQRKVYRFCFRFVVQSICLFTKTGRDRLGGREGGRDLRVR